MMMRVIALCAAAFASVMGMPVQSQNFTLQQALSAPFASDLVASPQLGRFAWIENQQGKRNLWMAKPDGSGKYVSKRLTLYDQDDGQEMYQIAWIPDAELVFPDEIHGFLLQRSWLAAYTAEADFFRRHLMSPRPAMTEQKH
jgi:hypothetical protein